MQKIQNRLPILCAIALVFTGAPAICPADSSTSGPDILFDNLHSPSSLKYIEALPNGGIDDSPCLRLTPDRWHRPEYRLFCDGGDRRDFSPYDTLEFYFRSSDTTPGNPTFYLKTWNQSSQVVSIADYMDSGVINSSWQRVSIPIADLQTEDWNLGNVEELNWNKDDAGRTYEVDHLVLRTVTPPQLITSGESAPFPESNRILRLTLDKRYTHDSIQNLSNYAISSPSDPAYVTPQAPLDTGIHYRVQSFSSSKTAINQYEVFIELPVPLKNGQQYILSVKNIADSSGNRMPATSFSFTYNDSILQNHNIKVNQIGYLPARPKIGYVGGYLGDLGGGAWIVGENGTLYSHNKRTGWHTEPRLVTSVLRAGAATRQDQIWAVGDSGTILCGDGSTWETIHSPTSENLLAIRFGPTNQGWAAGANGTILRLENGVWISEESPTTQTLRGIWAGPDDTAWAVGDGGTILCRENGQWVLDEQPVTQDLYAISGPHTDWLWACGANGTVLQYRYGHWISYTNIPVTSNTLRAMASDENGAIWIGGDQGLLWNKPGFGSSPFVLQDSGSTQTIQALSRQNGRQFRGAGNNGSLIARTNENWSTVDLNETENLCGVFDLPYGPLRLPTQPPQCSIRNLSSGQTALTVPLILREANGFLTGEDLYTFDFSALDTPGTYQAYVPGIGLSVPFSIGPDVLDHAAYTTARGLYYQRSGTALTSPFAENRFTRPVSHGPSIDALFHDSLTGTPLYANEPAGIMIDGHGGWHDAGDYGKYIPTAASALWFLFTAYDMNPGAFSDNTLNIPESGNGIPDLLDEARWEIDWIVRIQAADGGMYHKLTAESWLGALPAEENTPRFLFEKTTHDTASAAAVLACAARLWQSFDPQAATDYLNRAEQAWAFLEAHPATTPAGGFKNPSGTKTGEYNDADDSDNRLWAAAELFRTTGKEVYRDYFDRWWADNSHSQGWNNWIHFYKCAYWAYLRSQYPDADVNIQDEIRSRILRASDDLVTLTRSNPYHNGARMDVPDWIGWGAFTQSCEYSFPLLQAWALTSRQTYLDAAALNLDAQLGANPLSQSFITGLGTRYPRNPLHKVSMYDNTDEPIPGIPVFGVFAHMSNGQPFYRMTQTDENSYPQSYSTTDPYPILRRYIDAEELVPMSEFTIVDMAIATGVFHLMAE